MNKKGIGKGIGIFLIIILIAIFVILMVLAFKPTTTGSVVNDDVEEVNEVEVIKEEVKEVVKEEAKKLSDKEKHYIKYPGDKLADFFFDCLKDCDYEEDNVGEMYIKNECIDSCEEESYHLFESKGYGDDSMSEDIELKDDCMSSYCYDNIGLKRKCFLACLNGDVNE